MYGDLVMCSVAARAFKEQYPDSHLTFAACSSYKNILPLFKEHPYIDALHVWDSYEDWPRQSDIDFLTREKFDIVFHPFAQHTRPDWYNYYHYAEETCMMLGLAPPKDLQCYLNPTKYYSVLDKKLICLSLFPSRGANQVKAYPMDKCIELVAELNKKGYRCVQLGGRFETPIQGAEIYEESTFEDGAHLLLSCMLHISTDTSWAWISSAYSCPMIGLYTRDYPDISLERVISHNPVNSYATYINRNSMKDVDVDEILYVAKERYGI